jgi:flagellar biosynthesis chaperone FliJ
MITSTTTRKEYIDSLKTLIDDLNKNVSQWESDLQDARATADEQSAEWMETLRNKRDAAKRQLEKAQSAGEQAWDDIAEGALVALRDLEEAFSDARTRFSES